MDIIPNIAQRSSTLVMEYEDDIKDKKKSQKNQLDPRSVTEEVFDWQAFSRNCSFQMPQDVGGSSCKSFSDNLSEANIPSPLLLSFSENSSLQQIELLRSFQQPLMASINMSNTEIKNEKTIPSKPLLCPVLTLPSDLIGQHIRAYSDTNAVCEVDALGVNKLVEHINISEGPSANMLNFVRPGISSSKSSEYPTEEYNKEWKLEIADRKEAGEARRTDIENLDNSFVSKIKKISFVQNFEKCPKTYWLNRHSDVNDLNRESSLSSSELKVETRSLSLSDTPAAELTNIKDYVKSDEPKYDTLRIAENLSPKLEQLFPPEKANNRMQKRQKLKTYLQTRYETSLDEQPSPLTDTNHVVIEQTEISVPTQIEKEEIKSEEIKPEKIKPEEIDALGYLMQARTGEDCLVMGSTYAMMAAELTIKNIPSPVCHAEMESDSQSRTSFKPELKCEMKPTEPRQIFMFTMQNLEMLNQIYSRSLFYPVSPLAHHSPIGAGSNPPSPLVANTGGIRKYSSLGSSVQPSSMSQSESCCADDACALVVARVPPSFTRDTQSSTDIDVMDTREEDGTSPPRERRLHAPHSQSLYHYQHPSISVSAPPSPASPYVPKSPSFIHRPLSEVLCIFLYS